ncbi:ribosome biogenesis GTPase YlqF [Ruminococcaceae bacterium OttesenSCG-928-O06]|nr:ribosome biogenesis GTPase YlqF [Ruminococcaceae bacterium OttesenSCG-928-O06]
MSEDYLNRRSIHWFPGHMAKTLRRVQEKLPLVDAVVQLLDARIPAASLNPELQNMYGTKPRLYVLNKSDLADDAVTAQWRKWFYTQGNGAVAINSKQRGAFSPVRAQVEEALEDLMRRRREKGMQGAKTRLMITGIPNVGKSTFINNWAGGARARTADKPGVTRGEQWIGAGEYELLDMPGVLWKRFENEQTAVNLALIGSIPDKLLNTEEIAAGLLAQLAAPYAPRLQERFKLSEAQLSLDGWGLLEAVGKRRGMLISGGEVDLERAAIAVLDEFRAGKLGRVTLESPPHPEEGGEAHAQKPSV